MTPGAFFCFCPRMLGPLRARGSRHLTLFSPIRTFPGTAAMGGGMAAKVGILRKKDLDPKARRIERRLKARLRNLLPDLDLGSVFDAIRPQLAEAAAGAQAEALIERQAAAMILRALPRQIAQALAAQAEGAAA